MNVQLFGKYTYSGIFEYNFRYSNNRFQVIEMTQEMALQYLIIYIYVYLPFRHIFTIVPYELVNDFKTCVVLKATKPLAKDKHTELIRKKYTHL